MKRVWALCTLGTVPLLWGDPATSRQPNQRGYRIAGVAVHALTGRPLDRVQMTLEPVDYVGNRMVVRTGADGRFEFQGLPAARFELRAERRGFLPRFYQQGPGLGLPSVAIVTGPQQDTEDLVFRLYPPAAVWGYVSDEFGEPIAGAQVHLIGPVFRGRQAGGNPVSRDHTDDRGRYRFGNLPAGSYYLAVCAQPWYARALTLRWLHEPERRCDAFPVQYYPKTADPFAARLIHVGPNEEFRADFSLARVPGTAVEVERTHPSTRGRLVLLHPGPWGEIRCQDAEFTSLTMFPSVPPGRYKLEWQDPTGELPPAAQQIEVIDAHFQYIKPRLPDAVRITIFVQPDDGDHSALAGVVLLIASDSGTVRHAIRAGRGGQPAIRSLPPDRYRVELFAPGRFYLKGISADGASAVKGTRVDLRLSRQAVLKVVLGSDGGLVAGRVHRADRPVPGAVVLLAPSGRAAELGSPRASRTATDGRFWFGHLAPGDYHLSIIEDTKQVENTDSTALAALARHGSLLKVEPRATLDLRLDLPALP